MTVESDTPYYDPYDFEIDADPYPVWARLRDEAPLYYNEKYEFYALSRYDDVERALLDWGTLQFRQGVGLGVHQGGPRDAARRVHLRRSART